MKRLQRTRLAMLAMLSVIALATAFEAASQRWDDDDDDEDWGRLERPQYDTRDIESLHQLMNLTDDQSSLVRVFHQAYQDDHRALRDKAQQEITFLRDEIRLAREADQRRGRLENFEKIQTVVADIQRQQQALTEEFIASVQAVLNEEQLAQWPRFERAVRRDDLLPRGELAGEEFNLFRIVENLSLSDSSRQVVNEILAQYELQLDLALQRRAGMMEDGGAASNGSIMRAIWRGEMDADDALDAAKLQRALHVRVRDTNLQFARLIESNLTTDEEKRAFNDAVRTAAFSDIYEETYAQRVFDAVLEMDGIGQQKRTAIEALHTQYQQQRAQRDAALERLTLNEEPQQFERRMTRILARVADRRDRRRFDDDDDALEDAFEQREEWEARLVTQLRSMLTEEQVRQLPSRDDDRRRRDWN